MKFSIKFLSPLLAILFLVYTTKAQRYWAPDGYQYYTTQNSEIVSLDARDASKKTVLASIAQLTPQGGKPIAVTRFTITADGQKILINTNTKKVWRQDTRGDYWLFDKTNQTLKQIGKDKPASSLMFAKLSPDGNKVAYVSGNNIYVEDVAGGTAKALTTDGTDRLINGTFDWAYEEEFEARDGFRWSPDSKSIAYWQIDARKTKNYLMLNNTAAPYPFVVPVEYPVAGEDPSACKIGVVDISTAKTTWMNVPGDAIQHYIPRMEWTTNANELILLQLNRAQTEENIYICNAQSGTARSVYQEKNEAWVDVRNNAEGWNWINQGKAFLILSEKDGWQHIYRIGVDGKATLITPGNYDVLSIDLIDEKGGYIYFIASPDNATQRYLHRVKIGGGRAERLSPYALPGTHSYDISPNGKVAIHGFENSYTAPGSETISLPDHQYIGGTQIKLNVAAKNKPEFFKIKTVDGIEMDGWMVKPTNFNPTKKYPVVFFVYGEAAQQTTADKYTAGKNPRYAGSMADDGYIYMAVDGRGSPAPKGAAWRKAIYRNIGIINIRDQAMAATEILKWPFVDPARVAVWGWSGGGSTTLNLLFQYPDIYKTGIAVAALGDQLTYDNIYQERYMGVPITDEARSYYKKGSPITYAKNLKGDLLYIHGTGDDNVHYNNAELLINELVKYNKQFQLMIYPNRTHSINEGEGTTAHLQATFTMFLKEHCPPGGR
nr:DPP IV N-terminal domain-containing protein [uncultured Mucilaginibacter sp.]